MEDNAYLEHDLNFDAVLEPGYTKAMETSGYISFLVGLPSVDDVGNVQKVFDESTKYTGSGIMFCKGGPECKTFLRTHHDDTEVMSFVLKRFGVKKELALFGMGPMIIEFQPQDVADPDPKKIADSLAPRIAHPVHSSDALSLFRPLNGVGQWDGGLFAIYGSSHHQSQEEFSKGEKDIHTVEAHPSCVLALSGGLKVQPSAGGGLRMVWQGFSTRPALGDITNPEAFEFMTGRIR
ncbi:uncharacterized protein BDV17DRAFT_116566 [Aspergillus undulatus]|uniref:uncharacterized protein n=1 Tax=Aspergillus undulatus TaxID=1810928 RepID=UPI003CCD2F60